MSAVSGFWNGKRVFLTGNTGFKGSWLSLWLESLGAKVFGYALAPNTDPSLFEVAKLAGRFDTTLADLDDDGALRASMAKADPDIVIHMAAQPIVLASYEDPLGTYRTNILGTARVLDASRALPRLKAVLVITTDKCYENHEWVWGYRETDSLGGYDPYSSSKACAELVTASYRNSFFNPGKYGSAHSVAIATARAGNVMAAATGPKTGLSRTSSGPSRRGKKSSFAIRYRSGPGSTYSNRLQATFAWRSGSGKMAPRSGKPGISDQRRAMRSLCAGSSSSCTRSGPTLRALH
jgi:nucleoside-diphosphate-sugar epimerase